MADWYLTQVEFTGRTATVDECGRLYAVLCAIDRNAPMPTGTGITSQWRSPALDFDAVCDLLAWCGFPCRGRSARDDYFDAAAERAFADTSWYTGVASLDRLGSWLETVRPALITYGFADIVPLANATGAADEPLRAAAVAALQACGDRPATYAAPLRRGHVSAADCLEPVLAARATTAAADAALDAICRLHLAERAAQAPLTHGLPTKERWNVGYPLACGEPSTGARQAMTREDMTCPTCLDLGALSVADVVANPFPSESQSTVPASRPVVLTAEEAQAAAAGTLREIRRPVEPQPPAEVVGVARITRSSLPSEEGAFRSWSPWWTAHCPLGKPGDVIGALGFSWLITDVRCEKGPEGWEWAVGLGEPEQKART